MHNYAYAGVDRLIVRKSNKIVSMHPDHLLGRYGFSFIPAMQIYFSGQHAYNLASI
jgi:hypothetical protein